MPPRYAYWTILIDNGPTAFRAALREDLLPTLHQLQRKNSNVVMKWFERGRVWESPEAAREARQAPRPMEKRSRDWRPGGAHKDPRARFERRPRTPGDDRRQENAGPPARSRKDSPRHADRPARAGGFGRDARKPGGRSGPGGRRNGGKGGPRGGRR